MPPLRVALVGGPMYDAMYETLAAAFDLEVAVHADHPTLNREVARRLAAGERLDLISTHSKYAPSQRQWLLPLEDLVDPTTVAALAPAAVELCRYEGRLLSVPRNIDVRVLWVRQDLCPESPDEWPDVARLAAHGASFGFPGRESGLFGTFFELVTGAGASLYAVDGTPTMAGPEAVAACRLLVELAGFAPADLPSWHYDEVDAALGGGRVAMAATWPGGAGPLRASPFANRLIPAPYPRGSARRVSYAGCHSWAIPRTCADPGTAVALLNWLASEEAGALDASGGSVCAHVGAFSATRPVDSTDLHRLELTRRAVAEQMITYPPQERFPEVEDTGWQALHEALQGRASPEAAVARIQEAADAAQRAQPEQPEENQ